MTKSPFTFTLQLDEITDQQILEVNKTYVESGGHKLNDKLSKLFEIFDLNDDYDEVKIKVAALNTIYATSISYIKPVVEKLVASIPKDVNKFSYTDFIALVDEISTVTWTSGSTGTTYTRCNLSFASKYVHFLSNRDIPIYDSYIWIVMKGYLGQYANRKFSNAAPDNYAEFHKVFTEFKSGFSLSRYSNYDIDKYLWQHGKNMINQMMTEYQIPLPEAKRRLQSSMKERVY